MLMPKRVKHRRVHRGNRRGTAHRGTTIQFGQFALQAQEAAWIDSRQIEAARRAMTNYIKRGGKVYIRIFPAKPVTAKPAETRMGSGKGAVDHWVAVVKPGLILFELGGVREEIAKEAMRRAGHKLPIGVKFIAKEISAAEMAAEIDAAQAEIQAKGGGIEAEMEAEAAAAETAAAEAAEGEGQTDAEVASDDADQATSDGGGDAGD